MAQRPKKPRSQWLNLWEVGGVFYGIYTHNRMTNYMKKITKEANRIRRLQGSQPSARRNALNNYMTPSKNLITEYTSQSSKSREIIA